jgi:hypothetical protein
MRECLLKPRSTDRDIVHLADQKPRRVLWMSLPGSAHAAADDDHGFDDMLVLRVAGPPVLQIKKAFHHAVVSAIQEAVLLYQQLVPVPAI